MNRNDLFERICSARGTDDFVKLCNDVYQFLTEQSYKERLEIFAWYLQMVKDHYLSKENKISGSKELYERLDGYSCKYLKLVQGLIDIFSIDGYTENLYYQKLWDSMEAFLRNATWEEKGFCLYVIALDRRTPYYELPPGLKLSNERYKEIVHEIMPSIQKSRFAFHLKHCYKTELTSRIVHLLENLDNIEQKSTFLAIFLHRCEEKAINDSKKADNSEQVASGASKPPRASSVNQDVVFQPTTNQNADEVIEKIDYYPYPDLVDNEYVFALVKNGETIYLTDQGKTLEQLDKIFDLSQPDVVKNLLAILKQFGVVKQGNEFVLELKNWNGESNADKNEDLKKCILTLFSCVSFILNMKIFYVS